MKKLSLGIALLGLSASLAHAGGMDYDESGVFTVGVEFLYVEPVNSDFLYANVFDSSSTNFFAQKSRNIDSDYDWSYHIDVAYTMPGNNPNFTLGYTYLDTRDSDSTLFQGSGFGNSGAPTAEVLGFVSAFVPGGAADFWPAGTNVADGRTEYEYTDVDLVIGKEFVIQDRYHFHPFVGLRYADIESKDRISYRDTTQTTQPSLNSRFEIKNEFNGIGPRAGVGSSINISNGFSFVARGSGSLIIGDFDWKATGAIFNYNTTSGALESVTQGESKNHDENIVVPELDYRLGVNYTHEFSPETSLDAELGWTSTHYFNVVDKTLAHASQGNVGSMSDWSFQGPYVKLAVSVA